MPPSLWAALACPADQSPLEPTDRAAESLVCTQCGRRFPVTDGIPCLLPRTDDLPRLEAAAKSAERARRDAEAEQYDQMLLLRLFSLFELPLTLSRLAPEEGDLLLEVGCGTGRFTARLGQAGAWILAVDHSLASLQVARAKLSAEERERVLFIQADASYLPIRAEAADRVLSCQMLEHLPTPESRERAVGEMARCLRPGGRLALSAYWHPPLLRWFMPKEGRHAGEIYYYRFRRRELRELLAPHIELREVTARLGYVILACGDKAR